MNKKYFLGILLFSLGYSLYGAAEKSIEDILPRLQGQTAVFGWKVAHGGKLDASNYIRLASIRFGGVRRDFKILDLSNQGLTSLNGLKDIANIESVNAIYLRNNNISDINPDDFEGLDNTKLLNLIGNPLKLRKDSFVSLRNLRSLFLDSCGIKRLPRGVFNGLERLRELSLAGNDLQEFSPVLLHGLDNLQTLHLSGNPRLVIPALKAILQDIRITGN